VASPSSLHMNLAVPCLTYAKPEMEPLDQPIVMWFVSFASTFPHASGPNRTPSFEIHRGQLLVDDDGRIDAQIFSAY
jgi:hypothetical protein